MVETISLQWCMFALTLGCFREALGNLMKVFTQN